MRDLIPNEGGVSLWPLSASILIGLKSISPISSVNNSFRIRGVSIAFPTLGGWINPYDLISNEGGRSGLADHLSY